MPKGDLETYHEGGAWPNRVKHLDEVLGSFPIKEEGPDAGRDYVKSRKVKQIVRNLDGRIGERDTAGHDLQDLPH